MNIVSLRDLALAGTVPSRQVLDMVQEMAELAVQHDAGCEDNVREALRDAARSCLTVLGYRPPASGEFALRWDTLLQYLADYQRRNEAGPNSGETELTESDWLRMIRDEVVAVAGRPT